MNDRSVCLGLVGGCVIAVGMLGGCARWRDVEVDPQKAYIDARTTLRQAADDPNPETRAPALEALSSTAGIKAGAVYKQALNSKYPAVRFAAAMAIGDVKYRAAIDALSGMARLKGEDARAEPDKRVFSAVVYALHRLGDSTHTEKLGDLLFDDEKEVRANVAMIMGRLGEPSAAVPLATRLSAENDPSVELQLVEALAILGESRYIILMEAYTKMQWLEDRLVAISAMERIRAPRAPLVLRKMMHSRQPPRVRVTAAGALAALGEVDDEGYRLCLRAIRDPDGMLLAHPGSGGAVSNVEVNSLQRLAAISLGKMKRTEAVNTLHPLLGSQDGGARVAAAMSILRLLESYRLLPAPPVKKPETQPASRPQVRKTKPPKLYTAGAKD